MINYARVPHIPIPGLTRHLVRMNEIHNKEEVIKWCWEKIGQRFEVWDCYTTSFEREFFFNEEKDAVLFALIWG